MVNRKLFASTTAVLTTMSIPVKDIATRQWQLSKGNPDVLPKTNHRWEEGALTDLAGGVLLETFSLSLEHHHHGATPGCDVQRLVGRIENKNLAHASSLIKCHVNEHTRSFSVTPSTENPCQS